MFLIYLNGFDIPYRFIKKTKKPTVILVTYFSLINTKKGAIFVVSNYKIKIQ